MPAYQTIIPSGARTGQQLVALPAQLARKENKGLIITLNVTANPGGVETLTMHYDFVNPEGGIVSLGNIGAPAATNGTYVLVIHPEIPSGGATPKYVQAPVVPQSRVRVDPSAGGSWTYSVNVIPFG